MSEIDDRIVSMQFNNAEFERKLGETIASLDKLTATLKLSGATRGLEEVDAASKRLDMSAVSNGIEGVSTKFLALATIGITALSQITSKAIASGTAFVKSFTFAPIFDGFHEFETNMNSIQTILANTSSKGSTLEDVNTALDDLNHYSDKTIYNFSEMARNIGTFTAAGIDLDKSTSAIKGIANLAAVSGSNSEQASTAMYQLSQAMASGTVKLMDWNSVVNAGMGGEVFQKALFETGKQMKTISGVPMAMTFDQWKKAGNSFRGSLEDGWITADVLTKTLQGFTGDLNKEQVMALGYTSAQADEIVRMGGVANEAATKVKTLTQLIGTVKEAVGSGWTKTFQLLFGNFEESRTLFTGLSNTIGKFVGQQADARNTLLEGWRFLGGRGVLLQGLEDAFHSLADVVVAIKEAFRDIFPATTSTQLAQITKGFADFTAHLANITRIWMPTITHDFRGLFAAIDIVWEVLKGVGGLFVDLFHTLAGATGASTGILTLFGGMASAMIKFHEALVDGGRIKAFFDNLGEAIKKPAEFIKDLVHAVGDFISSFQYSKTASAAVDEISGKFERLRDVVTKIATIFGAIGFAIEKALAFVGQKIKAFFDDVFQPDDFDNAVDVVNVGLLGGIALLLKKFLNGGLKVDFGGGLIDKIKGTFDGLTKTLTAMQTNLKATALLKIAGAVGILTASVVALSLIDSGALTKALTALTVSFAQLIGAMTLLDKINFKGGAIKLGGLASGLILLATAATVLSIAIKNLSGLGWNELAKGLTGVAGGLILLTTSTKLIAEDTGGLIRAGIAIGAIAAAMYILAKAVQAFSSMSWGELSKGLIGVGVGLGIITAAMHLMPVGSTLAAGAAMIPLAIGLTILAGAVKLFSLMSWEDMAKGLLGVGAALLIIAGTMRLMPKNLPITAAGLVLVAGALNIMAAAILLMGTMDFVSMAKGIGGLGVMLAILVVAMKAMNSALAGAASLVIVAGALVILTGVLKVLGGMSLGDLAKGLGALAAVFVILGVAGVALAEVSPVILALGAAIALIGAGFALFGAGVLFIAKGFAILAKTGRAGAKAIVDIIGIILTARIKIVQAFADAIIQFAKDILNAAPVLVKMIGVLLDRILNMIIDEVPKLVKALGAIVSGILTLIRTKFPELLETGMLIITTILTGIRDHIIEITTLGADIIVNLVESLIANMPRLVEAAVNLIISFTTELANHANELVTAGANLIVSFLDGLSQNVFKITDAVANLIINFLSALAAADLKVIEAGANIILWFLQGIADNIVRVVEGVAQIVVSFIEALGSAYLSFIEAGFKVLLGILAGIENNIEKIVETVGKIVTKFTTAMLDQGEKFVHAGAEALVKFLDGIEKDIQKVIDKGVEVTLQFVQGLANASHDIADGAAVIIITFLNELTNVINQRSKELRQAGLNVVGAIIDGMTFGMASKAKSLANKGVDLGQSIIDGAKGILKIFSPSKVFYGIGQNVVEGFALGMVNDAPAQKSASLMAFHVTDTFKKVVIGNLKDSTSVFSNLTSFANNAIKSVASGLVSGMNQDTSAQTAASDMAKRVIDAFKIGFVKEQPTVTPVFDESNPEADKAASNAEEIVDSFASGISDNSDTIKNSATEMITIFVDGLSSAISTLNQKIKALGVTISHSITDGILSGLKDQQNKVVSSTASFAGSILSQVKGYFGINSPSKVFMELGGYLAEGMALGLDRDSLAENSAVQAAERIVEAFSKTIENASNNAFEIGNVNPVITPILDLTKIQSGSKDLDRLLTVSAITPEVSYAQAQTLATTTNEQAAVEVTPEYSGPREVTFEQNNYSPVALSVGDIYRNTKSQIAMAKEELSIP